MPIVNGNYYMNGDYGQSLEQAKIADAFPGLAEQTVSGGSWVDHRVFDPYQCRRKTDIH